MRICKRCLTPDTRPGSIFDEEGVCQACLNFDRRKEIDWELRKKKLGGLCDLHRDSGNAYDCVVAVSGGKDSHVLTWMMAQKEMKTLCINVADPFTHTEAGKSNLRNLTETFGCDLLTYTMPFSLFKAATRFDFEEYGHPLKFIEALIYVVPAWYAYKLGVSLLFYGEDPYYEYGVSAEETSLLTHVKRAFQQMHPTELPFQWEDEIERNIRGEYMSHYIPWDGRKNYLLAKQLGFKALEGEWDRAGYNENYDQIDSLGYIVHLWLKYPKFGFARQTDILSRWIRHGYIGREKALALVGEQDSILDQRALEDFCSTLGYTIPQFWSIVDRFYDEDIFEKKEGLWYPKK